MGFLELTLFRERRDWDDRKGCGEESEKRSVDEGDVYVYMGERD